MTDSDIQPLPSYWRGTVFRSRTEARWAVFFDAIGLRWEYEPEGFCLSDGTWYLPDFWLPEMSVWVEVKPDTGPNAEEVDKARMLVKGSGYPLLFLPGAPWPDDYRVLMPTSRHPFDGVEDLRGMFSKRYTIDRHDGQPRLYYVFGGDKLEDPWVAEACQKARAADLTEPDAGQYLPAGWEGTSVVF